MRTVDQNSLVEKTRKHYEKLPFEIDYFRLTIFLHSLTYDYLSKYSLEGKQIVDVGCSTAFIGKWLKNNYPSFKYLGIDISRKAIEIARKNGIRVKFGNNLKLNLPDNLSDLTISEGVIHHTPDPYKCFGELVRITKPGGVISLYVYNKKHLYYYVYKWLGWPCRVLNDTRFGRIISDKVIFLIFNFFYVQVPNRLYFKNKRLVPFKTAYNLYHDQILTPLVHFFTEEEIFDWVRKHDLKLLASKKSINGQGLLFLIQV